jgi:hypothetical protein
VVNRYYHQVYIYRCLSAMDIIFIYNLWYKQALKDIRALIEKDAINEAVQFAEENPHPRLWYF